MALLTAGAFALRAGGAAARPAALATPAVATIRAATTVFVLHLHLLRLWPPSIRRSSRLRSTVPRLRDPVGIWRVRGSRGVHLAKPKARRSSARCLLPSPPIPPRRAGRFGPRYISRPR